MPALTLVSTQHTTTNHDPISRITLRRRRERVIDTCFSTIVLTLLGSAAFYAASQLFTLAS